MLSYLQLVELVDRGVISPVDPASINASSIDIHLGDEIIVEQEVEGYSVVDPKMRTNFPQRRLSLSRDLGGSYDMQPGEFILAHSVEVFNLPANISAEFRLKSSGARSGLNNLFACHCFVAGTKVPMLDGTEKSIEDIVAGDYVYSIKPDGKVTSGHVSFSGQTGLVKETVKITLDDGSSFECTPDHLVMLRNGEYVKADQLASGAALMPFKRKVDATGYEKVYCPHMRPVGVFKKLHGAFVPTHKLVANAAQELTVHHKNENVFDNRPCNLEVMTTSEHISLHASERNNTPEGKARSAASMKSTIDKLWKDKDYREKMAQSSSNVMQKLNAKQWKDKSHRAAMRVHQVRAGKNSVLAQGGDVIQKSAQLGHIKTAIKKLIDAGSAITEEAYLKVKRQNAPTIAKISERFGSFENAVRLTGYENHSVVSVDRIQHAEPIPVYDITVDEHHNFALSSGVFVHNCDAGWHGSTLTLELHNTLRFTNLRLTAGMPIGQMLFHMHHPVPKDRSYAARGRYNGDASVSGVKL